MFRSSKKNIHFFLPVTFSILTLLAACKSGKDSTHLVSATKESNVSSKKLEQKYASLLAVDESRIDNIPLYSFIDDWYGVPYKYGGKNKSGIDCSNFTSTLYSSVYKKTLSGNSSSIYNMCKSLSKNDLQEGDLVFFKIETNDISHIGVYLQNNKFVHATTKKGIMIDDLDEPYYKKYFYKGGRIIK